MKKLLFLTMLALQTVGMKAQEATVLSDSLNHGNTKSDLTLSMPLEPAYLRNVREGGDWASNWFVEAKGGASLFFGSPIGKGKVFDHAMPVLQVGVGKWFTLDAGAVTLPVGVSDQSDTDVWDDIKSGFVHHPCDIPEEIGMDELIAQPFKVGILELEALKFQPYTCI